MSVTSTKVWGPHLWFVFFIIACNYPEKIEKGNKEHAAIKRRYKEYYHIHIHLLPCKFCRESYKKFTKELPIDDYLNSKKDLIFWIYSIKNKVNKKLADQRCEIDGKRKVVDKNPSFKSVYDFYTKL